MNLAIKYLEGNDFPWPLLLTWIPTIREGQPQLDFHTAFGKLKTSGGHKSLDCAMSSLCGKVASNSSHWLRP